MTVTETIYGVFFEPVETLREISQQKPVFRGLLLFALATGLTAIFNQSIAASGEIPTLNGKAGILLALLVTILSFGSLLVMAGVYALLSELIYKKTNPLSLLGCMSYASLPGVLGTSICFAFVLLGLEGVGIGFSLLGSLWVTVLWVLSLREALEIDTSQSILLFFLPPLALVVLIVISFIGIIIAFA